MLRKKNLTIFKKTFSEIKVMLILCVVIFTSLGINNLLYAMHIDDTKEFINTEVRYDDRKTQATIIFDIDSFNKGKYELISIVSDIDKELVYDLKNIKSEAAKNNVEYKVSENGEYSFTIKYIEKKDKTNSENISSIGSDIIRDVNSNKILEDKEDNGKYIEKSKMITVSIKEIKNNLKNIISNKEDVIANSKEVELDLDKSDRLFVENVEKETATSVINKSDNKITETQKVNLSNRSTGNISLDGQFNVSGLERNYHTGATRPIIGTNHYSISGDTIKLGVSDSTWKQQAVVLTSKNSLDFNRDVEITGKLNIANMPDGFAISLHNDKNYVSKNTGGSLGIYHSDTDASSREPGLKDAIVAEVDLYNNGNGVFSDGKSGATHVSLGYTDSGANFHELKFDNRYDEIRKIFGNWTNFKLSWKAEKNLLTFSLGNNIVLSTGYGVTGPILKKSEGYWSISSVVNYHFGSGSNYIKLDNFKYTDVSPSIDTSVISEKIDYAIPNEKITVRHTIKNTTPIGHIAEDVLYLDSLKIDANDTDMMISNIKVGTDINNLTVYNGLFDKNNPLKVLYPADSKNYYVQYDVLLPNLKNYGGTNQFSCKVLLGSKGMSQIYSEKGLLVKNAPLVISKTNADIKSTYDIYNFNSLDLENLKNKLWDMVYSKTSTGNEVKLIKETANPSGNNEISVKWNYYVDFLKVDRLPSTLSKGKVYSVFFEIVDSSDIRLVNYFKRHIVVSDNISKGYVDNVTKTDNYIFADDRLDDISETKLGVLTVDGFKQYIKSGSKVNGISINCETGNAEYNDRLDIDLTGWLDSSGNLVKAPGEYDINIRLHDFQNVNLSCKQKVIDNTWSYDTADRTENDGISGFIVIPKAFIMENYIDPLGKKGIKSKGEVFFAQYPNSNVRYKLLVDRNVKLKNKIDNSEIMVDTSSNGSGAIESGNKLRIGVIDKNNIKGRGYEVSFTALRPEPIRKGLWLGKVRFYFERI